MSNNTYNIEKLLSPNQKNTDSKYGIIVLNCPIDLPLSFLRPFWTNAAIRLTADGGTNRWFNYLSQNNIDPKDIMPMDLVTGDFDSITSENKNSAIKLGAKIVPTPEQDATDFTKAVHKMKEQAQKLSIELDSIFILQTPSGRMDQIMSNISTLYMFENDISNLFLLSFDSIFWLLRKGDSSIIIPPCIYEFNNSWCGLIPIGEKCEWVKTTGLKWNLDGDSMAFGKLVSTSNTYDGVSDTVSVATRNTLFWCMDLRPLFKEWFGIKEHEV